MNKNDNKKPVANHFRPLELNQLIQNGQPQFGVFSRVKQINYLDYYSPLISQKPLSRWRKDLKANQFCFFQIIEPPYRVCLAVATIKLATSAFVYLYNDETGELEVCEALQPLTRQTQLQGDCYQGQMVFTHAKLSVNLNFTPAQVKVALDSQNLTLHATLGRRSQPLAICTPTGRRGWTYTQKEPLTAVSGHIIIKGNSKFNADVAHNPDSLNSPDAKAQQIDFTDTTIANLDWTLGYMRHETNWFWTCINSYLSDGRHFTLNLSMGVNETGASENACWLGEQIVYLPPVMFVRQDLDAAAQNTWHIYHENLGWSNVDIDLTFTPITVYKKTDNFGVLASIFEQWLGWYSGEIRVGGEVIKIDKVMGLAEDHFAKW